MVYKEHVIIVVGYNDIQSIINYLELTCLLRNVDYIVIVDNCSTNGLYEKITEYIKTNELHKKAVCIQSEKNGGYAYGNNFGIKYAIDQFSPKYISISNSDVILNQEAISSCMNILNENVSVGFVSPEMKAKRMERTATSWKMPKFSDVVLDNLIILRPFLIKIRNKRSSASKVSNLEVVDVIAGSFYMGTTDTFQQIGFLDESTFLYCEENILAFKIKEIGKHNIVIKNVNYIHNHSESINKNISSVAKRLDILHDSMKIYINKYLNINLFQNIIYEITFFIGKYTYLLAIKILRIRR
jgi:GT2 family glycosyltransferase